MKKWLRTGPFKLEQANSDLSGFNSRLHALVETVGGLNLCNDMVGFPGLLLETFSTLLDAGGGSYYMVTNTGLRLLAALDPAMRPWRFPFPWCRVQSWIMW